MVLEIVGVFWPLDMYTTTYIHFISNNITSILKVEFVLGTAPPFAGKASIWQKYERKRFLTVRVWFDSFFSKPLIYSILTLRLSLQMVYHAKSE